MSDRPIPYPGEASDAAAHLRPSGLGLVFDHRGDALSAPTEDDLTSQVAALFPPGGAWQTPDGVAMDLQSRIGRLAAVIAASLAVLYARLWTVTDESTAVTIRESLADWEAEFGLPDPCFGVDQSHDARHRALVAKVRSQGTITPADFINLAASLGYEVTISEPLPFRAGASRCGQTTERTGASPFVWIVKPAGLHIRYFRAGAARAGSTPLGEIIPLAGLECLFNRLKPAWTQVVFDYSGA